VSETDGKPHQYMSEPNKLQTGCKWMIDTSMVRQLFETLKRDGIDPELGAALCD